MAISISISPSTSPSIFNGFHLSHIPYPFCINQSSTPHLTLLPTRRTPLTTNNNPSRTLAVDRFLCSHPLALANHPPYPLPLNLFATDRRDALPIQHTTD